MQTKDFNRLQSTNLVLVLWKCKSRRKSRIEEFKANKQVAPKMTRRSLKRSRRLFKAYWILILLILSVRVVQKEQDKPIRILNKLNCKKRIDLELQRVIWIVAKVVKVQQMRHQQRWLTAFPLSQVSLQVKLKKNKKESNQIRLTNKNTSMTVQLLSCKESNLKESMIWTI